VPNCTDAEVIQALKDAKIWDFVEKVTSYHSLIALFIRCAVWCIKIWDFVEQEPDQLLSVLQEGGSNLSGGQRQRLAIARAMVRRPDVILLDEATSALDNESEALVQEALDVLARKGSALVIAHRLSTIMDSEKIVVLGSAKDGRRQGTAVEEGTHAELLAKVTEGEDDGSSSDEDDEAEAAKAKAAAVANQSTNPFKAEPYKSKDEQSTAPEEGEPKKAKPHKTSYKRLWNAATGENDARMSIEKMEEKAGKLEEEVARIQKRLQRRKAKREARGASKN
jgi:ABC-type multidrug transport system ATPase subunit